jgi:hypothetical protein
VAAALFAVGIKNAFAQRPEVKFNEGHRSPLMAEISFRDGSQRTVLIHGSGSPLQTFFLPTHLMELDRAIQK